LFTLESVACLGCCSLAPVLMIGEDVYGRLAPKDMRKIINEYKRKNQPEAKQP
jgi:NADH-quinone oxidoreductase subunit E